MKDESRRPTQSALDLVVAQWAVNESDDVVRLDPRVAVSEAGGQRGNTWDISLYVTDRWGGINAGKNKVAGTILMKNRALLQRLQQQMFDEITFIVRKDGQFGILFEVEFFSLESEESDKGDDPEWYAQLWPHAETSHALLSALHRLTRQFPGVYFAKPSEALMVNNRPCAWAFVPADHLTKPETQALGFALLHLLDDTYPAAVEPMMSSSSE